MEQVPYNVSLPSSSEKQGNPFQDNIVIMSHTLLPTHTDANGTAFGGQIMAWMDICAGIAAKRHCRVDKNRSELF
jgi:acyl-CoA hydrolase